MFCTKCGTQNEDDALNCTSCGNSFQVAQAQVVNTQNVPNYLVWSILATIFCCNPVGIAGIYFASEVDRKLRLGDYDGAVDASKKAKLFTWITFGISIGLVLLWIGFVALLAFIGRVGDGRY